MPSLDSMLRDKGYSLATCNMPINHAAYKRGEAQLLPADLSCQSPDS